MLKIQKFSHFLPTHLDWPAIVRLDVDCGKVAFTLFETIEAIY
jgi:hypothetical protein